MNSKQDPTRYLLEQLMHEHGIDQHEAQFIDEAHRCADLIANGSTVAQALATLPRRTMDEQIFLGRLRRFLYIIRLRMALIAAGDRISEEDAEDLHGYLVDLC